MKVDEGYTRHPRRRNPCCGHEVDAATVIGEAGKHAPTTGDFSLCIYCGAWLRFTDDHGTSRTFDAADILDLTDEQRELMRRGTEMIHALHAAGVPPPPKAPTPFLRTRRPRR